MMHKRRPALARTGTLTIIPSIAAILLITVAATRPMPPSEREAATSNAREWAHANAGGLPATLQAISRFPFLYRKAILHELPPEQRKRLWQQQLDAFLTPPERRTETQRRVTAAVSYPLTDWQLEAIRAERGSLDGLFDPTINDSERALRSARMCMRNSAVLSREAKAAIFVWLGGIDSSYLRLDTSTPPDIRQAAVLAPVLAAVRAGAEAIGLTPKSRTMCWCAQTYYTGCECGADICSQAYPACEAHIWFDCGCGLGGVCDGAHCAEM